MRNMKGGALFIAIFALALLVIPMIAISFDRQDPVPVHKPAVPEASRETGPVAEPPPEDSAEEEVVAEPEEDGALEVSGHGVSYFRVLDESTGEVNTVSLRDFVRGAVAAEMPVSFHTEALKAQAVAAHTFALHNHLVQQENPDPALNGADFSADPSNMLVYITEETARDFYGENADEYWSKICEAADSVITYVLEYEDEPIVAAYHAISAGQTEDAVNVWTGSAPYLQAAESGGDLLAPDYETTQVFSQSEVQNRILSVYPAADLTGEPELWFSDFQRSDSGYVTGVDVGGEELHGKDIRTLFDLRSHNFDLEYREDGSFCFVVYGYGHGVGLSQYGADFMARQGSDYREILENYYTGAVLREIQLEEDV